MAPGDVALFPGAGLATRNHDVEFPFRQQSDFWYLTGLAEADALLMLAKDVADVPADTLFVLPKDPLQETWHGVRLGAEGAMEHLGFAAAAAVADAGERVLEVLPQARRLWCSLGEHGGLDRMVLGAFQGLRKRIRQGIEPPAEVLDPRPVLHEMRMFKSVQELDCMRRAAAISAEGHLLAMAQCQPGSTEYQLEALLHYTYRRHGCNDAGWAYPSIVAGGGNACILHYTDNDQVLNDGDLVLVDSGGEYRSYAADITRTFPVNGRFSPAQRDVYEVVLAAQLASIELSRCGNTHEDVHLASVRGLSDGLIQLGVLDGSVEEIIESESYKRWYMHNTGHWIGLDVHDAGRYLSDGVSRPLEAGMVMTVEPGLYFRADDEEVPEEMRGLGIRIEDDVHITGGDPEVLTAATPKTVADVEDACSQERVAPPVLDTETVPS